MLLHILKEMIANQRVLLLGFGREGRALSRRIHQVGGYAALGIADANALKDTPADAVLHIGSDYQNAMEAYDIVFKSPGIVLERTPADLSCRVTSLTELFLSAYRDQCIGITGTKGKSTTSSLLYHVLQTAGVPSVLGGNIGIPMAELYEQITPETVIVLEIGVHQLEYNHQSPKTAVLLNLFEEHLDHYGTLAYYAYCKENIYRNQHSGDTLICGVKGLPEEGDAQSAVLSLGMDAPEADITLLYGNTIKFGDETQLLPDDMPLTGVHNRYNCAVVYALARMLHVEKEAILRGIVSYQPLPHRLSPIGTFDGIRWYDDSISTACETCIQALNSLPETDTVLIGGIGLPVISGIFLHGGKFFPLCKGIFVRIQHIYRPCGNEKQQQEPEQHKDHVPFQKKEQFFQEGCVFGNGGIAADKGIDFVPDLFHALIAVVRMKAHGFQDHRFHGGGDIPILSALPGRNDPAVQRGIDPVFYIFFFQRIAISHHGIQDRTQRINVCPLIFLAVLTGSLFRCHIARSTLHDPILCIESGNRFFRFGFFGNFTFRRGRFLRCLSEFIKFKIILN